MDDDMVRAEDIRDVVARDTQRTPLVESPWLSELTGTRVHLKCENRQVTGSFKVRGALAAVSRLTPEERTNGVVTCSAGNHGAGLAYAARRHDVPCTVVVPRTTPQTKLETITSAGAKVIEAPHDGYDATQAWTLERLDELGGTFVSPFDDLAVMAGNGGTLMLEILEDLPDPDLVIIPCGGGGCSVGAGMVAHQHSPRPRIVAVNTDASPGMWLSRRDGRAHLEVDSRPTIAEGLEGGVSARSFKLGERFIDEVVLAREETLRRAVRELYHQDGQVVEGSGAAGVAALLDKAIRLGGAESEGGAESVARARSICVVLTGSNIDLPRLQEILAEAPPPDPAQL